MFCDCEQKKQLSKQRKFPYRLFYFAFTPRKKRKVYERQVDLEQKKQVAQDWERLLLSYFEQELPTFEVKAKKDINCQNVIWQYWGQGIDNNLPEIVQLCFASIDKYKDDFTVIRLDDDSLNEYLEFPDFIWEKRKNPEFKPAFFADLLRLALLYHYGGIWVDATILLTAPIDKRLRNQDFFVFSRHKEALNQKFWLNFNSDYFGWHEGHYVNILNSFIVAKKENTTIKDCLQIMLNFWHNQNHIPHYFFFQIMFDILQMQYANRYQEYLKIDDTLPHLLVSKLNQPFNEHEWENILSQIHIHKLTYVKKCVDGSYYDYLKKSMEIK